MSNRNDHGPGALYPFCPVDPGGGRRRGRPPKFYPIFYARDGHPDRIVTSLAAGKDGGRPVKAVDVLDWYHARKAKLFPKPLYDAGVRLRNGYEAARSTGGAQALDPSSTHVDGGGAGPEPALRAAEMMNRHRRALRFVGGPDMDRLLAAVVCEGVGMAAFERRNGWPARSGQLVLRQALYRLALHYGLIDEGRRWAD